MIDEKARAIALAAAFKAWDGSIVTPEQAVERIQPSWAHMIEAAITAYLANVPATKEGWVMVPVEPTREMWAAMGNAIVGYKQRHHDKVAEQIWTAALAAAPPSPSPVPAGGEMERMR